MKKNKMRSIVIIAIISAIFVVLLFCLLFREKEIVFEIIDKDIKLKINETKKINYSLNNNDLKIEWSSSNDNITVNNNGEITATTYGTSTITAYVVYKNQKYVSTCTVTVYTGDVGVSIERIDVPLGYVVMMPNSEFELSISIVPSNAYISSIQYETKDENIVAFDNNIITSKNPGKTSVKAWLNDNYYYEVEVMVTEDAKTNQFVQEVDKVTFNESNPIQMEIDDSKTLSYDVVPKGAYVYSTRWNSSNEDIVSVINGELHAKNVGKSTITLLVNDNIEEDIEVNVKASKAEIKIDYNPKTLLRIGEKTSIKSHIEPIGINDTITYSSTNSNIARVDNGIITAISPGTTSITLSISNGKTKKYTINVLPKNGSINGTGNLWGYKSLNAKTPVFANSSFYQSLAQKGVGVFSNNTYKITSNGLTFSYDISTSKLSVNNKKILVKIMYPLNEDLSTLNTLVYMGGRGETNFSGVFKEFEKNPTLAKSAGIIALLAEGEYFTGSVGSYVTKFIKAITNQQPGVKNSILGFSDGAHWVMDASKGETYDRYIIFSGYVDWVNNLENAKNKEVIFMVASRDGNYNQAKIATQNMIKYGYKNITFVSMGSDLSKYTSNILVINPGSLMRNGHYSENVLNSGIIEYAND